jgi:hypothetical protein
MPPIGGIAVASEQETGELVEVREWDADQFHVRVMEMEGKGFICRRETYHITAEMDPETGNIIHLHRIEMFRPK